MIDKVKQTIQQAGDLLKEQAGNLSGSALERLVEIFEDWATVFPRLEAYGLTMINFSLSVGLSPGLTVLMTGQTVDFEEERIKELLEINAGDKTMLSVLRTLQTSLSLYRRTGMAPFDSLQLKVVVGIPPEIKVTFGQTEFS